MPRLRNRLLAFCLCMLLSGGAVASKWSAQQVALPRPAVDSVRQLIANSSYQAYLTPVRGLYLVKTTAGGMVMSSDGRVGGFGVGQAIDMQTRKPIDVGMDDTFQTEILQSVDVTQAIRLKYGSGRKQVLLWSAVDCPSCVQMERMVAKHGGDVTFYLFPTALTPSEDNMKLVKGIWCSVDSAGAWHAYMREGKQPAGPYLKGCTKGYETSEGFSIALGVAGFRLFGTPAVIYEDGRINYRFEMNYEADPRGSYTKQALVKRWLPGEPKRYTAIAATQPEKGGGWLTKLGF